MTWRIKARAVRNALLAVTLVSVVAMGVAGMFAGARLVPVLSGSMSPNYPVGSLVLTVNTSAADLRIGDVIAFAAPEGFPTENNQPVMHRVMRIDSGDSGRVVTTKGDSNPAADPWALELKGMESQKAIAAVPYLGRAVHALTTTDESTKRVSASGIILLCAALLLWLRKPRVTSIKRSSGISDELRTSAPHDLRTPLATVSASLEMLMAESNGLSEDQQWMLQTANRNTERLVRAVEDTLAVTGLEHWEKRKLVDIDDVIGTGLTAIRQMGRHVTVVNEFTSGRVEVNPDAVSRAICRMAAYVEIRTSGEMRLTVAPNSPGLVFTFEAALEPARAELASSQGGQELARSVVNVVARAHGGTAAVRSTSEVVKIELTLPLNQEAPQKV
jgi:signal peptidase I